MPEEEWRPVRGHEGRYEVSSLGQVRGLTCSRGVRRTPLILAPQMSHNGYVTYTLRGGLDRTIRVRANRLVAEAFLGSPPTPVHQAAHCDGDRSNNSAENLRWATPKENTADKFGHGTILAGERHYNARLTKADAVEIRRLRANGVLLRELAERFGVSIAHIHRIASNKTWKVAQ